MFGRISKSHAVSQTVLLIANHKDISSKIKVADNLVFIKNTTVLMPQSFKKNIPNDATNKINNKSQKIKVVCKKVSGFINEYLGRDIENKSKNAATFSGGTVSSNENRSNNMLSRYFNDKLFGKAKERRNILLYTQEQLNYSVKNEQSEKVVVIGGAGQLTGYYHKGTQLDENKNKITKVVLFLHGSGSPVEQQSIAVNQQYQSHAVDVLTVNMRGYGKSEGRPSEKGFYQDAQTMFNYLVNEKGITPDNIIIHGYSMGAPIAADLARYAERNGMVVSGLLLDRPMPSMTKAITAHWVVNPAGSVGALFKSVNGQFSVEKNIKGLTNNVPIMLLTDSGGLGVEGEKLRSKLVASGYHVMGEKTGYTHEQSGRLMYQYTSNIVSSFSG